MKKRIISLILLSTIAFILPAQNTKLGQLWSEFEKAKTSDLPQEELKIISAIKKQAASERSAWDYYKACENEYDIRNSINWKDRDNNLRDFRNNILSFKSAVIGFYFQNTSADNATMLQYVEANKEELKSGHNKDFYINDFYIKNFTRPYGEVLTKLLDNDYDYALWNLFLKTGDRSILDKASVKAYPFDAFADYSRIILHEDEKAEKLDAISLKYNGKAAGMLAEEEIIRIRFDELVRDGGTSEQFKDILNDCKYLENKKNGFSGTEKEIALLCTQTGNLMEELNSKSVFCTVEDDTLKIFMRNLPSVHTIIRKDGSAILSFNTRNPLESFYATDTAVVFLPSKLDDGTYEIECSNGETVCNATWDKYTLSLASCRSAEGYRVFVADYFTGEPIKGYEQGFVPVEDDEFQAVVIDNGRTRLSRKAYGKTLPPDYRPKKEEYSGIICDRKVFRPEETVHFKVYHSLGGKVKAYLLNPSSEIVDSLTLTLGDFGTAAGGFKLTKQNKIGYFNISVRQDNKVIASTRILVEAFKLPSFKISLNNIDRIYLKGDTATVSGTIRSYSGHNLSEAQKTYTIKDGKTTIDGTFITDATGHFSISFPILENNYYMVSVKVADRTGEVCEASKRISTRFHHYASILNSDLGDADNYDYHIVSADQASIEFKGCKHPVRKVHYTLSEAGRTIAEGTAEADTAIGLALPHPGLYSLKSKFCDQESETFILHVTDDDKIAPKGVRCFFRELWDDALVLQTGSEDENHWTVAEIFSPDNKLLDSKMLRGTGIIRFEWETEYPDVVALRAVSFAKGESYSYSFVRKRNIRSMELPLSVSRFTDKTSPDSEGHITIETNPDTECAISIYDKGADEVSYNMNNRWKPFAPFETAPSTVSYNILEGKNGIGPKIGLMRATKAAAIMEEMVANDALVGGYPKVSVRSDFESTILWEPMLHPDNNGQIPLNFKTKDGTGTFVVQMFAHDKSFNNAVLAKEMLVSLPLEISVREPEFLYEGDSYSFRATISNSMNTEVTGICTVIVSGAETKGSSELTIPAGGSAPVEFNFKAPETERIDITTSFVSKYGNDAVKVSIPIRKPVQTICESHSAFLNAESDKAALEDSLRKAFTNMDASTIASNERTIAEMIEEAYPKNWKPAHNDAISLSASLWLGTDYVEDLLLCRGEDGGFGWMQGMESSAIVTAVVLERIAMRKDAFEGYIEDAVRFLDRNYFSTKTTAVFRPRLSMEQYLYVRSLYPEIKCNEITDKQWNKEANAYLSGRSDENIEGLILYKARRAVTNLNLGKHKSTVKSDLKSLRQYAVGHPSGGKYFPNAVRFFKGLLETELYAHTKLCELFGRTGENDLADDIKLWMMVQKETQDWKGDPALADAVNCVRSASDKVLGTKVISLKAEREIPFSDIGTASNGISIETSYESDTAATGTKIKAIYKIKSDENRSFVLLTVPHCAGMTPVDKKSGPRSAYVYRNVLADRTEYWMEVCREDNTTLQEEFFISQKGDFQMPAPTIECLYAPHYRGNGTSSQKHFSDSLTTNVLPPM